VVVVSGTSGVVVAVEGIGATSPATANHAGKLEKKALPGDWAFLPFKPEPVCGSELTGLTVGMFRVLAMCRFAAKG
jgi:hypothetical protein